MRMALALMPGVVGAALLRGAAAALAHAAPVDLAITGARVLSPPLPVRENVTILVDAGRIAGIVPASERFEAHERIDATGRTVVPGLIDTHVHFNMAPFESEAAYLAWVRDGAPERAREYVRHGFTTIQSVGDYWPGVLALRERLNAPGAASPRLLVTGPMITPAGGHGAIDFPPCNAVPYCDEHGWFAEVASVDDARALVARLADAGVDGIKVAHDGNEFAYPSMKPMGRFAPGVLRALVSAAHARGLRVYAHAYPIGSALEALDSGVDAMSHGPGLFRVGGKGASIEPLVARIVRDGVPVSTTLSPQGFMEDPWGVERDTSFGGTEAVPYLKQAGAMRWAGSDVAAFLRAGMVLAFGTDMIYLRHPADVIGQEFGALAEAGLDGQQLLQLATANAARFLGRERDLGSVEEGKIADLAILSLDPAVRPDFYRRVDVVIRGGELVWDFRTDGRPAAAPAGSAAPGAAAGPASAPDPAQP